MGDARTKGPVRAMPTSPHLQVWRWHITMAASIFTRVSGVALYVGILMVAGWALALASGPEAYLAYMDVLASPLGRLVLFGITAAIFYHLAAGIRHLVFDTGHGFAPAAANMSAVFCIAFAVVATLVVWGLAYATGAV